MPKAIREGVTPSSRQGTLEDMPGSMGKAAPCSAVYMAVEEGRSSTE